ncbi:MAG: ComEA family DNA-binding protein [Leptolyngbyaceae cyanobacterium T60_A2020_046]|nr:ComEA family DNA-binding protein [Leptolyngbyaceae cyanobacterium T60_A2020_046]
MGQWRSRLDPVRARLLRDPYGRLQSLAEVPIAAELGIRIDVNRARVDDWLRLPGLSIHQARMLENLTRSGLQFYGLEDLAAALGLTAQALQPLAPLLQFCYYDPESGFSTRRIALNQATVGQLMTLPGMQQPWAEAIAAERRRRRFVSLADFQARLSVPPEWMACWMHYLWM